MPGLELVYLWNGFSIMGLDFSRVERYYVIVEQEMETDKVRRRAAREKYELEDNCLLLLLKGMCLKYMSAPLAAEECFRSVLDKASREQLQADKYILPYATVELALILMDTPGSSADEIWSLLEAAKTYKDYSLQSRLHFRIHAAQHKLKAGDEGNNNNFLKVNQMTLIRGKYSITNFLKDEEEMMINLKEDKGNILRDLENCSDSQIREMVPHI